MFCCAAAEGQPVEVLPEAKEPEPVLVPATKEPVEVEQPAPEPELPKGKPVQVSVIAARGIRNTDWAPGTGKSDAFVTVDFVGGSGGFKTPVIKDSLQPVWKHEGELQHVPDGATLEFTVWDQDTVGKELLGKVRLPASQYEAHGFNGELQLAEAGAGIKAYLKVKVKVPGKDFPAGLGASFAVVLEKPSGGSFGLDVDVLDGTLLQVCGVRSGAAEAYNQANASNPDLQLTPGLYIMDVNGVSGSSSEMLNRMKDDSKITLKIHREQQFPVLVDKKGGTLGLDLNYAATGVALQILKINEGPLMKWNEEAKETEVKKGDRIVSVNGVSGNTKDLFEAIKASEKLQLIISRPASDSWWAFF